jgi:hypothetical protein
MLVVACAQSPVWGFWAVTVVSPPQATHTVVLKVPPGK